MKGRIYDIQPFSIHDGPGTRTTVFFQGCPLSCAWCHNPESQPMSAALMYYAARCIHCGECAKACPKAFDGVSAMFTEACVLCGACAEACYADALKLSGYSIDSDALAAELIKDKDLFVSAGGGVTFSGGEPAMQADFISEVVSMLPDIHTAVETCACVAEQNVDKLLRDISFFYVDLKCVTPELHMIFTGADNRIILSNIQRISESGADMTIRVPVVPTFNADRQELDRISDFILALPNRHRCELLAYHSMCKPKYETLNRRFVMDGVSEPTTAQMEEYTDLFIKKGIDTIYRM